MLRLLCLLAVVCASPAMAAGAKGPLPPKHISSSDSRFGVALPNGANIGPYDQLGDDPKIGTAISFVHPQRIACTAAGARVFDVADAIDVTVDLTWGDVPLVNFTVDGKPRAYHLPATSMACALTGDTKAGVGVVTTVVNGGTHAGNAGFSNFDAPQTITCYENGRAVSQATATALSLGAANGVVGLNYMDEDGQPATYEYDGQKTACVIETVGLELTGVNLRGH